MIRGFKRIYPINIPVDLVEIVKEKVEFYSHCVTRFGIELGYWEFVGNNKDVGEFSHIWFRDSDDFDNPDVEISQKWWVWRIN